MIQSTGPLIKQYQESAMLEVSDTWHLPSVLGAGKTNALPMMNKTPHGTSTEHQHSMQKNKQEITLSGMNQQWSPDVIFFMHRF